MKQLRYALLLLLLVACSVNMFATDPETNPASSSKINVTESSSKINLWIPGFLVKMVAEIAEDHVDGQDAAAVELMKKFGTISISIREGAYYNDKSDKKMTRKLTKMEQNNFESLMSINSADAKVNLSIRENKKGKIKRLVVLVDEPGESYVYIKMHCRISANDIATVAKQFASN